MSSCWQKSLILCYFLGYAVEHHPLPEATQVVADEHSHTQSRAALKPRLRVLKNVCHIGAFLMYAFLH